MKFPLSRADKKYINSDMKALFDSNDSTIELPIAEYNLHQDIFDAMAKRNCLDFDNIFNRSCILKRYDYKTFKEWANKEDKKARQIPPVELKIRLLNIVITIATSVITTVITTIILSYLKEFMNE